MYFDRANYINLPLPIEKELKILFQPNETLTIFEIGACEGEDSIKYARLFPNATLYAFEPLPNNIKLMEENYAKYGVTNVFTYNQALSAQEGTAEFYVSEGRPEDAPESDWDYGNKSSSLLPPDKHLETASFVKFNQKIKVNTTTIKSFCEANDIETVDFIHLDVQGAELIVLEGASNFISRIKAIWLEVSKVPLYKGQPLVDEVKEFMSRNNFLLLKDCMEVVQGDHLYISKAFYPDYEVLFAKEVQQKLSPIRRILKKIGL